MTDIILTQQVAENSLVDSLPSSPIAPPYSPLTPPLWYADVHVFQSFITFIYRLEDIIHSFKFDEGTLNIEIRHSNLVHDAFKEGKKKKFNPCKILKVCIII